MHEAERELLWLRRARDLTHALAEERDPRRVLRRILDAAVELTEAERGFLVRVTGRRGGEYALRVEEARGFDQTALRLPENRVSRTVVKRVLERDRGGLVTSDGDAADLLGVSSVQRQRALSILCAPMRVLGQTRGVLYLDHRAERAAFDPQDLAVLRLFADQAALVLEAAEALPPVEPAAGGCMTFGRLIGGGEPMEALFQAIRRAASAWAPALILGESGTGKALVAEALHQRGPWSAGPLRAVDCAQGAADLRRDVFAPLTAGGPPGYHHGTIVLREPADLDAAAQALLVQRVRDAAASGEALPEAPRLVATSHRDLKAAVAAGALRRDLYYRLDVLRLEVPPLRARGAQDVPTLLAHFAAAAGSKLRFTPRAEELLRQYAWPGNVRELRNETLRLVAATAGRRVTPQDLSAEVRAGEGVVGAPGELSGQSLGDVERRMVAQALADCRGNKAQAARRLGIPRTSLYNLIKRYGLE